MNDEVLHTEFNIYQILPENLPSTDFSDCIAIYKQAFPKNERVSVKILTYRILNNQEIFYCIKQNHKILGFACFFLFNDYKSCLLDYIVISPENQGKKVGSFFLESLKQILFKKYGIEFIICELERPNNYDSSASEGTSTLYKRIQWYQNHKFKCLWDYLYFLPNLEKLSARFQINSHSSHSSLFLEKDFPSQNMLIAYYSYHSKQLQINKLTEIISENFVKVYNIALNSPFLEKWLNKPK